MLRTDLPEIITETLPGPKAQAIIDRREAVNPSAIKCIYPVVIEKGEGAMIQDVDGNKFLDWIGGVGVLNIGFSHPEVVEAVKAQAEKYFHGMYNVVTHEGYVALSEKLAQIASVKGDKKKVFFARIDTRLLHGQVATTWTKMVNPDRIIVVSDAVAKDDLRKRMIIEAAPPGVKAHVIPIWKMIEVAKDPRFGETKAMLLFETPQDVLKAIEGGVDIKEINLGSLAHSTGKVVVTKAVAMGKEDVETFEKLIDKGVTFNVRKVPSDSPENMDEMLKKAKAELK